MIQTRKRSADGTLCQLEFTKHLRTAVLKCLERTQLHVELLTL